MTGTGNNTYLITNAAGPAALVDAGVGSHRHLEDLRAELEDAGAILTDVLVTHGHLDHAGGAAAIAEWHSTAHFRKHPWPGQDDRYPVAWEILLDGDVVEVGHEQLRTLHTPGHSPDHLAFLHEPSGTVFTGDLVVFGSSVMIDASHGGSLAQYLASLERILAISPRLLLPAHGPCIDDPRALLVSYLEHRRMRERQIIDALKAGPATVEAIAESIYDRLDPALMVAARENVRAHLEKLRAEGSASVELGRWRL